MVKRASTIGLKADPRDPDDFDASEEAIELALEDRRHRGPQRAPTKRQLTVRFDQDVVEHYKAGGRGWQARMNADLRHAAGLRDQ
ncbi:hypothetical protein HY78_14515 [Rhizorhabdus wittichii DC-6]|nr:hypothetical protein HY78_14515 [Rhizorhabdus wittichii DC-6]